MKSSKIFLPSANSANFREICMGNIVPNKLFRSSHPIKENKQEETISMLAQKVNISTVINLSDTMSDIWGKAAYAPWYNKLLSSGKIIALGMDFRCTSTGFRKKLKEALQFIIHTDGPYLIHCHAGVDRTGFICMVLESFMGASLDEVIKDYLMSFDNDFKSSIFSLSVKADADTVMQILSVMSDSQAINEYNLQHITEIYLRSKVGLSVEEVEVLRGKLSKKSI